MESEGLCGALKASRLRRESSNINNAAVARGDHSRCRHSDDVPHQRTPCSVHVPGIQSADLFDC